MRLCACAKRDARVRGDARAKRFPGIAERRNG
jgi:hypothetical protein